MAQTTRSTARQIASAQNATKYHDWPPEVGGYDDQSWAIFVKFQCFRAYDDWNDADLFELARVAKLQAMAVEEMESLESEGLIIMGGKAGTTRVENPRNRAINTINGTITAMMRRLGITSSNSGGDRSAKANRGKQERSAAAGLKGSEDEQETRSGRSLM